MVKEGLAVVLGGSEQGGTGTDRVARLDRSLTLLNQLVGEALPGPVPTVTIPWSDLSGDLQALAHVGHPGVGFTDGALELSVEVDVIKKQFHVNSSRTLTSGRR